jgi:glycosyltransferase involved in cell wall biosynthesis
MHLTRKTKQASVASAGIDRRCSLLIVTARYVPEIGGTELHTSELVERLSRRGHHVTVLATDRSRELPHEEFVGGVHVRRVPAWPRNRDYYLAPSLYRAIRHAECDVIHVQGYHTFVAPIAMVAALRSRTPFVLAFHSGGHSSRLRRLLRGPQIRLLAPLLRRARFLISGSDEERTFFADKIGIPPGDIVLIPVARALETGETIIGGPPANTGPLIVSVGRLEEYKGHHLLIGALPYLRELIPEARLQIVGDGPFESRLRRMVDELGLNESVAIESIPLENRTAMAKLLEHSALAVSLSSYESAGIAIREAMAMHRKVLVSNTPGYDDIRDLEGVYTINLPAPPELIATALAYALDAPDPSPPEEPAITWEDVTAGYEAIYAAALDRSR